MTRSMHRNKRGRVEGKALKFRESSIYPLLTFLKKYNIIFIERLRKGVFKK